MANNDLRRHDRQLCSQTVAILWCDSAGNDKCAKAATIDVSELGMRLQVPEALSTRSFITIRSEKMNLHGQASVRHCARQGMKYVVGVELERGLRLVPNKG